MLAARPRPGTPALDPPLCVEEASHPGPAVPGTAPVWEKRTSPVAGAADPVAGLGRGTVSSVEGAAAGGTSGAEGCLPCPSNPGRRARLPNACTSAGGHGEPCAHGGRTPRWTWSAHRSRRLRAARSLRGVRGRTFSIRPQDSLPFLPLLVRLPREGCGPKVDPRQRSHWHGAVPHEVAPQRLAPWVRTRAHVHDPDLSRLVRGGGDPGQQPLPEDPPPAAVS